MKNKKLLTMIVSAILACAMIVSLCACGGGNDDGGNSGKSGGNTNDDKSAYAALQKGWDDTTKAKSAEDTLGIKISLPFGSTGSIDVEADGVLVRKYKGSEIESINGYVTHAKVSGSISDVLGVVSQFANLDLNKIIKKGGKDANGSYYETTTGKLYYEADPETGAKDYWFLGGETMDEEELASENVTFKYVEIYKNGAIEFGSADATKDDALIDGTFYVSNAGAFSAEGSANIQGILDVATEKPFEIDPETVDMAEIKSLMKTFNVTLDLDAANVFDLTTGDISLKNGTYTSKIQFSTALAGILAQLDGIYAAFMAGDLDATMIEVFNGFAEEKVSIMEGMNVLEDVRGYVTAFAGVIAGNTLSAMLNTVLQMDPSSVKVKTKNDKIDTISGTQTGKLVITTAQVDAAIEKIDEMKLVNDGDIEGMVLPIPGMSFTVGSIKAIVLQYLFKANNNTECQIGIEVTYSTKLSY